jgi:hypothetical protein
MNKLVTVNFKDPSTKFQPTFVAVEGVTEEGFPVTFAVIYRNKHGRSNMIRIGTQAFLAGGKGAVAVRKHAVQRRMDDHGQFFIERGVARSI